MRLEDWPESGLHILYGILRTHTQQIKLHGNSVDVCHCTMQWTTASTESWQQVKGGAMCCVTSGAAQEGQDDQPNLITL